MSDLIKEAKGHDLGGKYFIGKVVDNDDPEKMQRVRVRIPFVYENIDDEYLPWCVPIRSRVQGVSDEVNSFHIPIIGTDVIIFFDQGDRYSPLYVGDLITLEDLKQIPGTSYTDTYGIVDAAGNKIYVDTSDNTLMIEHTSGSKIRIKDGKVLVDSPDIELKANFQIEIDSGGTIKIKASRNIDIESGGTINIKAAAMVVVQGSLIRLN